jgi:hypothetical protein
MEVVEFAQLNLKDACLGLAHARSAALHADDACSRRWPRTLRTASSPRTLLVPTALALGPATAALGRGPSARGQGRGPAAATLHQAASPGRRRRATRARAGGDASVTVVRPRGDEDQGGELDGNQHGERSSAWPLLAVADGGARSQRWTRTLCTIRELAAHARSAGC